MSYCTTGWMAVTTLAHSQSHSDDDADDDDDDDPGPARKPLFLAYTQSRAPQTAPTGQGQAIRSMKGRGRPAVGRVARLLSARWWAVALPPTSYLHLLWPGLVWSGLVCEQPRLNQRRHERGFPRSCITTCDTSYNCTRAGRQVVRRVGRLVETAAAQRREKEACELDVLRNMKLPPSSSLSSKRLFF